MNVSKRVVIIERDPEWCQFVTKILSYVGYDVHILIRGMLIGEQRALFLVDGSMAGYIKELARERRQFIIFDNAPTIPNAISAYRAGALDYMGKTFDPELLLRTVAEAKDKQSWRLKRLFDYSPTHPLWWP